MRGRILEVLRDGPLAVPGIAAALDLPEPEVMVWAMGMRKYGYLVEDGKADGDGYFRYRAVEEGS